MWRAIASVIVLVTTSAGLGACGQARHSAYPDLRGDHLEVAAVWTDTEQERFEHVLRGFERATGATVTYTSGTRRLTEVLNERLQAGNPPDVAILPQPGLLRQYARAGQLVPVGAAATDAVRRNYAQIWRQLGSVDDRLYGVYVKAADKSLVWYDIGAFERAGVVPAESLDGLLRLADTFEASGLPAFSVGGGDGWVLTDWFENIFLRLSGPERYDLLANHRLPWTDPTVKDALRVMAQLLVPGHLAGAVPGTLTTKFEDSVKRAFAQPPGAAMVFEGDFVAGTITGSTRAQLAVDADVFAFPTAAGNDTTVVGGGDAAVLMKASDAGQALLAYFASPEAAAIWAAYGGYVSPNVNLDLSVYPDEITRGIARAVLDAGDNFRFDLSDLQPAAFGNMADRGMRKILQDFLVDRDVDRAAARLEAEATAAYS